jgi:hypothetical protein
MHAYAAWALERPARFRLTFGRWTVESAELGEAADAAQRLPVEVVAAAQRAGALPAGDPVRPAKPAPRSWSTTCSANCARRPTRRSPGGLRFTNTIRNERTLGARA